MSAPTNMKEWHRQYGQYFSKERAPNGDFQVRSEYVADLVDRLVLERRGVRARLRHNDALYGQTRMEVLGEFLDEARAALDALEGPAKLRGYRDA